jgi:ATP-dependent exoDNAse (exonuclease V) beta subunit
MTMEFMREIELINASAGSGKTHSLTGKVMEKLSQETTPESLIITTFTNKAAAELRERIRRQLLKQNMPDEALRISDGFVGTVNSTCARLLKEYALDAGLSAALDVLPEEDGERLFRVAVTGVVAEHADAMEETAGRLLRSEWLEDVRKVVDLARMNLITPEHLLALARDSWESIEAVFGTEESASDLDNELDDAVSSAIAKLEEIDKLTKMTTTALDALKKFKTLNGKAGKGAPEVPWSDWLSISKLKTAKDGGGILDEVRAIAGRVLTHPRFRNDVRRMVEGVFACAAEALASYENFKKKQGLMDFADQEIKVLELAKSNEAFMDSIKDRLSHVMVDEFQDTNPIQLSLFLALHDLTGHSTWVGDPKQAIYGFRGTDAHLMDEVTALVENSQILGYSWRSKELLVHFCNAVYSQVFRNAGEEKVRLKIPAARKSDASGGELEMWRLSTQNTLDIAAALASGIRNLLRNEDGIEPGDIAVLCRTNTQCENVAKALAALNIRASVPQGSLLQTRECRLALAALRYTHDRRDTLALAEIVCLSPLHADHETWLSTLVSGRGDAIAEWERDPAIGALSLARKNLRYQTPLEALKEAVDGVNLPRIIKSWSSPQMRRNNLDKLCGVCVQYMDQCKARRTAATVGGFVGYLREIDPQQAEGFGRQTVQVSTWHRAKGLEWPIVVLASLDSSRQATPFGTYVLPAPDFDPNQPLAHRSIRFWPWPFGKQKRFPELETRLSVSVEDKITKEQATSESRRLLYVGMTRARDRMIFAARKRETKNGAALDISWLDELSNDPENPLILWPIQEGRQQVLVAGEKFPITVKDFSPMSEESSDPLRGVATPSFAGFEEEAQFVTAIAKNVEARPLEAWPPAHIVPSALAADETMLSRIVTEDAADFKTRIPIWGKPDFAALGNAIHGFFAADADRLPPKGQLEVAKRLLSRWNVEGAVEPSDVLKAEERLRSFIASRYPGARVLREWPVSFVNEKRQRLQGWIDLLLELPDGYVVVDHKTTPNVAREHAKSYAPQLLAYKEAVERATGKPVLATLLHLPVCGLVVEVRERSSFCCGKRYFC